MHHKRHLGAAFLAIGLLCGGTWAPAGLGYAASASSSVNAAASASPSLTAIVNKPVAAKNSVTLQYEGKTSSLRGMLVEGRSWIPVAFLRDDLKLPINYNPVSKTYTVGEGYRQLNIIQYEGGITSYVNSYYIGEPAAKNINGRIYIPFQWVKNYLGYQGKWDASAKLLKIEKAQENKVTIVTSGYDKDSEQASIHLKYPQLKGNENKEAETAINNRIKEDVNVFRENMEKQLKERESQEVESNPYAFESSYIVTYNQNGVLSLLTEQYENLGGAHGMVMRKGYTFSLKDGKLLSLDDLFGANKNYSKQLNSKLSAKLDYFPGYFGGFKGLSDQPDFYLEPDNLKVFFQLYEYTPYAAGFPEFSIAFNELIPKGSSPFDRFK